MEHTAETKVNPLGRDKISTLLFRLALPSVIALLVNAIYNMEDQIFIGHAVGFLGNAATNVAYPLTTIALAIAQMPGQGGAASQNLHLGAGNRAEAENVVGNTAAMLIAAGLAMLAIVFGFMTPLLNLFGATPDVLPYAQQYTRVVAFGIPFTIFSLGFANMVRADGGSLYSMISMIAGAVINVLLDPLFIFVFHWGMTGAALSTVMGQALSCIMIIVYIPRFKHIKLRLKNFIPSLRRCFKICSLGIASTFNLISNALVQITMNNSMTYYGARSVYGAEIPLACTGIMMKVNLIFISCVIGIAQGEAPIVSFNYGAKNYDRVRRTYLLSAGLATAIAVCFFFLFQLFPRQIMLAFGEESELYFAFAIRCFRIFLFATFLNGVQAVTTFFFTGIGKPIKGAVVALTRQAFLLVPLVLILPLFFGIDGIMYAGPIADAGAFILSILFVAHEMRLIRGYRNSEVDLVEP